VMSRMEMTSSQQVKRSTAVKPNKVYVDVKEMDCQGHKVAQWSNYAGDFGALAGLASLYPGTAILPHTWPTKHCATSFTVALMPGCDRSWTDWNNWSCRGTGTDGQDLPADVSQ
jgi:hypothetical protein